MAIDPSDFKRAMGQFATGINVVTTRAVNGAPLGLTVNAFCSVSLDPPLVLVCIEERSETNAGFRGSGLFAVSVLAEGQERWSRRFAQGGAEKFTAEPLATGASGLLLVPGAVAHIECRIMAAHEAGDHTIYVGLVTALAVAPGPPLVYHAGGYHRLWVPRQGD